MLAIEQKGNTTYFTNEHRTSKERLLRKLANGSLCVFLGGKFDNAVETESINATR